MLDPSAPGLADLSRAVQARTADTECAPEAVAADLCMLPELLRERHFGIATGATAGMIEYGNIVPYVLPTSGLHIGLTTKHNDYGVAIELVGLPVQAELDPSTPLSTVARAFDRLYRVSGP